MAGSRNPASESARDAVMGRIREALGDGPPPVEIPRDYERALPPGRRHPRALCRAGERLPRDRPPDDEPPSWATRSRPCWPREERLGSSCRLGSRASGSGRSGAEVTVDDPPLSYADLDALDGVVTGCAIAIAETGTIVLDAGPDQGRRAISLLPDLHVCVVMAAPGRRDRARGAGPARPRPAPDLDQRSISHERHRTAARRRRPRPTHPRRRARRGLTGLIALAFRRRSDYHPSHARRRDARRGSDDHVVARAPDRDGSDAPQDASEMAPRPIGATVQGLRVPVPWHRWGVRTSLLARADAQ